MCLQIVRGTSTHGGGGGLPECPVAAEPGDGHLEEPGSQEVFFFWLQDLSSLARD